MIDYVLNHLPGAILYFLAEFFLVISFLFAAFQQPDLSNSSLKTFHKIVNVYAPKKVELPIEFLKNVKQILINNLNKK